MNIDSKFHNDVLNKLKKFEHRSLHISALTGLQKSLLFTILSFLILIVIESVFRFDTIIRTILFVSWIMASFINFFYLVLFHLLKKIHFINKPNYLSLARVAGNYFPSIKDELINTLQLISIKENAMYSRQLVEAAFGKLYEKIKGLSFESVLKFDAPKKYFPYTISIIVFSFLLTWSNQDLSSAAYRLTNYDISFTPPPKFTFHIEPGSVSITKGESVNIVVKTHGISPKEITLNIKDATETGYENFKLLPDSTGAFFREINAVRHNTLYYATAEGITSEEFTISVIDRPAIQKLKLKINSPSYTNIASVEQIDNGNVTGLIGTIINLSLISNKELSSANILFEDSSMIPLKINSNFAETVFRIQKDNNYKLILRDKGDNENLFPVTYSIKAIYDAYPEIDILSPNMNINMPGDERLPLTVRIADDYGFNKLILHHRLSASVYDIVYDEYKSIEIPIIKSNKESVINYIWNLSLLKLATEDVLSYYLEVFDNDNVSGPKSAKSKIFTLRVPSLTELFQKADEGHKNIEKELKQTLKEAEELKKILDKLENELKQDKKDLNWEEKEKIEQAVQKFEELQQQVDEISEQLKDTQQELRENNLLSKETLEKYLELQKLMQELSSEEMRKAMEQMQNLLNKMDRKQIQQELEKMQINEEMFQKSIERTLNLLKRIQVEQKVDELIKRSEELTKQQEKLSEETDKSDSSDKSKSEEMSQKQDRISKEIENLSKQMEELQDKMSDLDDMPNDKMDEIKEDFDKQKNKEESKKASEQLKNNQKQQAQKSQQQLSKNMKELTQNLMEMQNQMNMQNQMKTFAEMLRILDNLITLSKEQEKLADNSQKSWQNSSNMDNAIQQDGLRRNLDKIVSQMSELSQKTFAITPEMGKTLGDSRRSMNSAIEALQNRNANSSAANQGDAMKSLNETATLMKSMLDMMSQGGGSGGSGMMSLMQQLQKMAGQQMQLNSLTQMLQQNMSGQLSPEQQGQLQRLAQEQEMIRKSLEQLNEEAKQSGKSKTLPSNLEDALKKMEEVISDMKTDKLNDELVQKQERILSRLLDAQRSINERDFEKERESNTGERKDRQSPPEIRLNPEQRKNLLKEEFNKAIREGYSKDYEELIRKYYESLQKELLN